MKTDNGTHVIVCRSYGDYRTYACTVANAQAILETHRDALASEILEVSELFSQSPRTVEPVSVRLLRDALDELLSKKPGDAAPKLRRLLYGASPREGADTRPDVTVTDAGQKELVLWLFEHGLSARPLDSQFDGQANALHPENKLEVLKPFAERMGKPIHYVLYPEYVEAARELGLLQANRWKDDAQEHRVVEQYLRFVREWLVDPSDTTYEVSELRATFE